MGLISQKIRVVVFCGGRGSSSLIRELTRWSNVKLTLLINAYDDGLSTGELRKIIPGMLGPSDVRKTVSNFIDLYSNSQYAVLDFLNYRFPVNMTMQQESFIIGFFKLPTLDKQKKLPRQLGLICNRLEKKIKRVLFYYTYIFFDYLERNNKQYRLADSSMANLFYAGIFISTNENNKTINKFKNLFISNKEANVINVTSGEDLVLVGLKKDGQFMERESTIVGEQSQVPIEKIFLLRGYLNKKQIHELQRLDFNKKLQYLQNLSVIPEISSEAKETLEEADIIIYGPGTQHSSLLPSYITRGVREAIKANKKAKKILIININEDYDTQTLTAQDIFDNVLKYIGDDNKNSKYITHTLYTRTDSTTSVKLMGNHFIQGYGNSYWLADAFERHVSVGIHMGSKIVDTIFSIYENDVINLKPPIDIMVSIYKHKKAVCELIEELKDLNWDDNHSKITFHIQDFVEVPSKIPQNVTILRYEDATLESSSFKKWLNTLESRIFVSLIGDGVNRMKDVFFFARFLDNSAFSAVLGSRNQDKKQMIKSASNAYGYSKFWYFLWLFVIYINTSFYLIKYQKIFSDPLTGFRLYKKSAFKGAAKLLPKNINQFVITNFLLRNNLNIAELPVFYRTYSGFTDKFWRIKSALKGTLAIFFG